VFREFRYQEISLNCWVQQEYPETNAGRSDVTVEQLQDSIVGKVRKSILLLLAAVVCVLLIASANLAGLLLVRATTRFREMAIRVSLGASRGHLLCLLVTERVLIGLVGGILGLALAAAGHHALLAISPSDLPRAQEIGIDTHVLAFTAVLSLGCGLIFGLAPAWELSCVNLNEQMKAGGRGSAGSVAHQRVRRLLVVAQVAVSLVLLAGSGLLTKSFVRLEQVSPGFEPRNLLWCAWLCRSLITPAESK
jgi:putative ABC transport system permease protein